MTIWIRNGRLPSGERADVVIERGTIAAVGVAPAGTRAETVIDAEGLVVAPGLVDGHRHVWQAPLRGTGADLTLGDYLGAVLGTALAALTPEAARAATLLGAAQALDAGITTVFDWCNAARSPEHLDAILDAYAAAGIRAVLAYPDPDDAAGVRRIAALDGRVTGALAVPGPEYGPFDDAVRHLRLARELGLVASAHAGGGPGSPLERLDGLGLLGPHLHLVHLNGVTDEQARRLGGSGTGVTVTPVVEATMGHGESAFSRLAAAGVRPGLGTDVVVNAPADLFEPLRDTLRRHRLTTRSMVPAAAVLPAATTDSAAAIGLGARIGALEPGRQADVILLSGLSHVDGAGLAGALVVAGGPRDVHTVIADGVVVKSGGRLLGALSDVAGA